MVKKEEDSHGKGPEDGFKIPSMGQHCLRKCSFLVENWRRLKTEGAVVEPHLPFLCLCAN